MPRFNFCSFSIEKYFDGIFFVQHTHHFPNEISMDNENIALRFEMKDIDPKDDMTDVNMKLSSFE